MQWASDGSAQMRELGMEPKISHLQEIFGSAGLPQTMSSACSGIRTPELSQRMMGKALGIHVKNLWAIERDANCQAEILVEQNNLGESGHVVGNMLDLFEVEDQYRIMNLPPEESRDYILRTAIIKQKVPCLACRAECALERAHIHVAGTPCVHDSRYGKQQKTSGKHAWVFWSFVKQRMSLKEPFWIAENVTEQGSPKTVQTIQ